ncbi:MAG TPA: Minf_1886 family protein [Verrucomicrobiae bacterium]|nr:Minf_1886 family protein [Verrucomicrobiae bacterium]
MHEATFEEGLELILARDSRYHRDAYLFLREALDYTQKAIIRENRGQLRHVSGQELLGGIREFALEQFGPMAMTVLEEWGVRKCEDFGEIVFNMVEVGLLAKTEKDSREDFQNGYNFFDAFRKPFLPKAKQANQSPAPAKTPETNG